MAPISIIIAVYNCEKYIEICAQSLFEQTLGDIEFVFVNDATQDNSISILKKVLADFPLRQSYVKIIDLETNSGVAHAREIGINNASG